MDLPEGLVEEAQEAGGLPTKRAAVVAALEEFVRTRRRAELRGMLGKVRMSITHEDIRTMREDREPPDPHEPLRLARFDKVELPWPEERRRRASGRS